MMPYTITVAVGSKRERACHYCGRRIVWVTALVNGQTVNRCFDREPIFTDPFRDERGVRYERWPRELLHANACTKLPARRRA